MPNPNPIQTDELKAKQFKAYGKIDVPLAKKNTQIKLPIDVQEALDKLDSRERVIYLRKLISDAVRRDFVLDSKCDRQVKIKGRIIQKYR